MTAVNTEKNKTYEFGPCCLNASERLLLRGGNPVPVAPKVFDTLVALVENGGRLVSKDDLMSKLWPDTFVEEGTLTRNIVAPVYVALGDKDEAFRILGKAVDEHNSFLVCLKEDPPFENLHSDPRWKVLLRRMNFPQE